MTTRSLCILCSLALVLGCSTTDAKSRQLERVAKDWAMVIRASQVIPVYPLTEDIQPGDVFLVQTPVEEQVRIYKSKGFLPFDQLVTRLPVADYGNFYQKSHGIGESKNTPYHWRFPGVESSDTDWKRAPRAAFPSYSFSISKGEGINLALPVQGVPVGLSLMRTRNASGSIAISDAYTYGMDITTLDAALKDWSGKNREFLKQYAPIEKKGKTTNQMYLRVVNRVYLTGGVSISLANNEAAAGAGAAGGADKGEIPELMSQDAASNREKVLASVNSALKPSLIPNTSVKVSAASSRSVTMNETFPRPLVIGYLASDIPILKGGMLGGAESTNSRLNATPTNPTTAVIYGADQNTLRIQKWMAEKEENRLAVKDWVMKGEYRDIGVTGFLRGTDYSAARSQMISDLAIP